MKVSLAYIVFAGLDVYEIGMFQMFAASSQPTVIQYWKRHVKSKYQYDAFM